MHWCLGILHNPPAKNRDVRLKNIWMDQIVTTAMIDSLSFACGQTQGVREIVERSSGPIPEKVVSKLVLLEMAVQRLREEVDKVGIAND